VTVTGQGTGIQQAGIVLRTVERELSAAHTQGYTTALALLAALAVRLGSRTGQDVRVAEAQCARLPELMANALATEARVKGLAQVPARQAYLVFVGGGPQPPPPMKRPSR
jgi:glucosamine 6-phosphate synthetase-like amidotransferase/phosphosugar isomerase protein